MRSESENVCDIGGMGMFWSATGIAIALAASIAGKFWADSEFKRVRLIGFGCAFVAGGLFMLFFTRGN